MHRSRGLVVMGGDSCSEGCRFESQHHMLDGHFWHIFVVKIVMFGKTKRIRRWPIFKTYNPFRVIAKLSTYVGIPRGSCDKLASIMSVNFISRIWFCQAMAIQLLSTLSHTPTYLPIVHSRQFYISLLTTHRTFHWDLTDSFDVKVFDLIIITASVSMCRYRRLSKIMVFFTEALKAIIDDLLLELVRWSKPLSSILAMWLQIQHGVIL